MKRGTIIFHTWTFCIFVGQKGQDVGAQAWEVDWDYQVGGPENQTRVTAGKQSPRRAGGTFIFYSWHPLMTHIGTDRTEPLCSNPSLLCNSRKERQKWQLYLIVGWGFARIQYLGPMYIIKHVSPVEKCVSVLEKWEALLQERSSFSRPYLILVASFVPGLCQHLNQAGLNTGKLVLFILNHLSWKGSPIKL